MAPSPKRSRGGAAQTKERWRYTTSCWWLFQPARRALPLPERDTCARCAGDLSRARARRVGNMGEEEEGAGETLLAMGWLEITLSTLMSYSGARLAPDGAQRCEMTIDGYRQICVLFLAFMDIGLGGWNWFDIGSASPAVGYGLWVMGYGHTGIAQLVVIRGVLHIQFCNIQAQGRRYGSYPLPCCSVQGMTLSCTARQGSGARNDTDDGCCPVPTEPGASACLENGSQG